MRWSLIVLLLLLVVLQYRLWIGEGSFAQQVELERQIEQQQARNDRLRERNRILAEEVEGLRNDPDAVEERARTDLGMVRSDETFFLVLDERRPVAVKQPETGQQEDVVDSIPEGLFEE